MCLHTVASSLWGTLGNALPTSTDQLAVEARSRRWGGRGNVCGNAGPLYFTGASQVVPALALPSGVDFSKLGCPKRAGFEA